jgi:hypothetical protein
MDLESRIQKLIKLGDYIREDGEALQAVKVQAKIHNQWFTIENIDFALQAIANEMLVEGVLRDWISKYEFGQRQNIGLILAGNIPLVGFHDILSVYICGHKAIIKASSKDSILTLHLIDKLDADDSIEMVERLVGMDAVIATGSNQSAKQFERYFQKYPNIIRRNRNAISVIGESLTEEETIELGKDIFTYFGLGCRNVSKIYLPEGFDKVYLMEVLHDNYKQLINHSKYKNNYDYNHAIFLMNADDFLASGAVLLRRHDAIVSRIATIHYEEYSDLEKLGESLKQQKKEIQCISGNVSIDGLEILGLGQCQKPNITDYADGVDTLEFLSKLA